MTTELKPCPCCGSDQVGGVHDQVYCDACGLMIKADRPLANAIAAWNRRVEAPTSAVAAPWQPIATAPKDGTNVLPVNFKGNMAAELWQGEGELAGWWMSGGNSRNAFFNGHYGLIYWIPLPDAPPSAPSQAKSAAGTTGKEKS